MEDAFSLAGCHAELSRQGNNLNQIARTLNERGDLIRLKDITEIARFILIEVKLFN